MNSIYTIVLDAIIPLVIIGILLMPFIVLDKYLGYRRKKEKLGLKWKKLQKRIGDDDIKALVHLVAAKSEEPFDTSYPLIDAKGNLLKHQPIASSESLKHLEKHVNEELGYLPQPIRPGSFIRRTQPLSKVDSKV